MLFLTISNEIFLFTTQSNRHGMITPNKGLEWALISIIYIIYIYIYKLYISYPILLYRTDIEHSA